MELSLINFCFQNPLTMIYLCFNVLYVANKVRKVRVRINYINGIFFNFSILVSHFYFV